MPIFEIQGPDGGIYEVDAPDEKAAAAGFQKFNVPTDASTAPDQGALTAAGRGAAQGFTFGLNDEMRGLVEAGGVAPDQPASLGALIRGGYNLLTGSGQDAYRGGTDRTRAELKTSQEQHPIATTTGEIGGALTGGLGLVGGGLSLGANAARAGQGLGSMALGSAVDGAAIGALQGAGSATEGQRLEGAKTGGIVGGGLGLAAPLAISGVSNAVRRAVTPLPVNAERQAAANVLRNEGVELTAGQTTGSKGLRYAESEIGGNAAENVMERQGEQFTRAALSRAAVNADRATPQVIDDAFRRIGGDFDALAARNQIIPDHQLVNDLRATAGEYSSLVPESMRAPVVFNVANDIVRAIQRGPIDGAAYQSLRSQLERASRASRANPELTQALRGMRESLDDAMERSIAANNPADAGAWRDVRGQYRNMLVLEKAATGAGENAALGLISPSALRNATVQQGRRAYARGQGDFSELARAGEALMKAMPNSGTAGRLRAQNLSSIIPTILGGGVGAGAGGPLGAVAGAAAGAAVPRVVGALMMSRPGQAYLSNQLLSGQMTPQMRAIANLLLTNSAVAVRN